MFQVVRNSPKPLGDQLVEEVSRLIESGRLPEGHRLPSVRQLARRAGVSAYTVTTAFQRLGAKGLIEARPGSDEVAAARAVPRAQVALAWVLQRPGVTAPIVGATKLEHLESALASVDVELTDQEIARLEEPYVPHPTLGHG